MSLFYALTARVRTFCRSNYFFVPSNVCIFSHKVSDSAVSMEYVLISPLRCACIARSSSESYCFLSFFVGFDLNKPNMMCSRTVGVIVKRKKKGIRSHHWQRYQCLINQDTTYYSWCLVPMYLFITQTI